MGLAWKRKSHDAGVINNDDDNGQRPEKIEAGLALTIGETRIDSEPEWRCTGFLTNRARESRK